jgi:glycosyltransferase involved in cell wall biosynthesis
MSQIESKKINVLVLPSDRSGVGKFRSVDPHVMLQNLYPDDFHVDIDYEPKIHDVRYWKNYQIVHFHRAIGHDYNTNPTLIKNLRSLGIVTIMDLDDYWLPTKEHPIHSIILQDRIHEKILANLREVDYVTTTTKFFADEIRKHNKNVIVLPNAIDPNEKQFNVETEPSDRIRVAFLGGSSHLADLKLLNGFVDKNSSINNKIQYVLCGFDTRGTITEINNETGERKQRNIRPEETVWARYEEIFTNKYKIVDPKYKAHLLTYNQVEYPNEQSMPYRRVWTKPVNEYAANYGKFDISLAPLVNHIFNGMKSNLKAIEAGFHKKALIASEVGPYTIDLKHCLKNGEFVDGNALLVPEKRNHSDWAAHIKKLVNNPNLIKDMGERLYETVKDTYDLRQVTKTRASFYKSFF